MQRTYPRVIDMLCPKCCSKPGEKCMSMWKNYVQYFHVARELKAKDQWIENIQAKYAIERRRAEVDY